MCMFFFVCICCSCSHHICFKVVGAVDRAARHLHVPPPVALYVVSHENQGPAAVMHDRELAIQVAHALVPGKSRYFGGESQGQGSPRDKACSPFPALGAIQLERLLEAILGRAVDQRAWF